MTSVWSPFPSSAAMSRKSSPAKMPQPAPSAQMSDSGPEYPGPGEDRLHHRRQRESAVCRRRCASRTCPGWIARRHVAGNRVGVDRLGLAETCGTRHGELAAPVRAGNDMPRRHCGKRQLTKSGGLFLGLPDDPGTVPGVHTFRCRRIGSRTAPPASPAGAPEQPGFRAQSIRTPSSRSRGQGPGRLAGRAPGSPTARSSTAPVATSPSPRRSQSGSRR